MRLRGQMKNVLPKFLVNKIWLIENIYFLLNILLQNKYSKMKKYFFENILHQNKQNVRERENEQD